ncbi:hypothetical protein C380_09735 [Acidovorax sp. KKS102]|uniref:DUF2829 domain-containing protein n=1 Tax=Acidovorax sp. KKS102 TaxID=358220 RepID=UPI00028AE548|nr:DUF2829 domain-containing protein [Acidovorax sp. KKS102]AFU45647.1 hypothetical protein C380_09735 [Acidovorax sp. KKS102]
MNKMHIGVKLINAEPMTRAEYNTYRGWTLPADENGADEGFLVEYLDGGKANMPDRAGYVSWSPSDVFKAAYRPCLSMTFGLAIEAMKMGKRVARAGWNGKGMWLGLVQGYEYNPDDGRATVYALGCQKLPWIGMKTADGCFVPWLASQTDMLAEDWAVVD